MEFEQAFWPQDVGVFVRAVQTNKESGHLQTWINIHRIVGVPALSGYLGGRPAEAFEKLSDDEAEKAGKNTKSGLLWFDLLRIAWLCVRRI